MLMNVGAIALDRPQNGCNLDGGRPGSVAPTMYNQLHLPTLFISLTFAKAALHGGGSPHKSSPRPHLQTADPSTLFVRQ